MRYLMEILKLSMIITNYYLLSTALMRDFSASLSVICSSSGVQLSCGMNKACA